MKSVDIAVVHVGLFQLGMEFELVSSLHRYIVPVEAELQGTTRQ
jgi:hypothetical protein